MDADELLSMQQAADALAVSRPTFYEMLERGEVVPTEVRQLGRQIRRYFRRSDIEALHRKRAGEQVQM
jgi:excisionase family DNA binding protein